MKKIFFALIVVALTCVAFSQGEKTEFSKQARSERLITPGGKKISFGKILKKHSGRTTVIEVWASWCGDCVKAMPKLKELQAGNPDVDYVFVSMDKTDDKWKSGIDKHELKGDHYWAPEGMKGTFGQSIDLDWIPRYIVIDKTGKVVIYRAVETDFEKINETLKNVNS